MLNFYYFTGRRRQWILLVSSLDIPIFSLVLFSMLRGIDFACLNSLSPLSLSFPVVHPFNTRNRKVYRWNFSLRNSYICFLDVAHTVHETKLSSNKKFIIFLMLSNCSLYFWNGIDTCKVYSADKFSEWRVFILSTFPPPKFPMKCVQNPNGPYKITLNHQIVHQI